MLANGMAESREGRLRLALQLCMRGILESCSDEQFMSHFAGCVQEHDTSSLRDLAALFRQFLQLSMQNEAETLLEETELGRKLDMLDRAATGTLVDELPSAAPELVVAGLRHKLKMSTVNRLAEARKAHLSRLNATQLRYEATREKVQSAVSLVDSAERYLADGDETLDRELHGESAEEWQPDYGSTAPMEVDATTAS